MLKICLIAFCVVFSVLGGMALFMRLLVALLPQREEPGDVAVVAAISTAVATVIPGARVTRIEEK
jgi:hypothetical protein